MSGKGKVGGHLSTTDFVSLSPADKLTHILMVPHVKLMVSLFFVSFCSVPILYFTVSPSRREAEDLAWKPAHS